MHKVEKVKAPGRDQVELLKETYEKGLEKKVEFEEQRRKHHLGHVKDDVDMLIMKLYTWSDYESRLNGCDVIYDGGYAPFKKLAVRYNALEKKAAARDYRRKALLIELGKLPEGEK